MSARLAGSVFLRRETEHSSTPSFACRCNSQAYRASRGAVSIGADLIFRFLRAEFAEQIEISDRIRSARKCAPGTCFFASVLSCIALTTIDWRKCVSKQGDMA